MDLVSEKLNGTTSAEQQTKPSHCCNLAAGHLMWQRRSPGTRLVGEDSTSLKSPQWMLMTSAKHGNVENEAVGEDDESTDEDPTESKTQEKRL